MVVLSDHDEGARSLPTPLGDSPAEIEFFPRNRRSPRKPADLLPFSPAAILPVITGVTRALETDRVDTPATTSAVLTHQQGKPHETTGQHRDPTRYHITHGKALSAGQRPTSQATDLRDCPVHPRCSRGVFPMRIRYVCQLRGWLPPVARDEPCRHFGKVSDCDAIRGP